MIKREKASPQESAGYKNGLKKIGKYYHCRVMVNGELIAKSTRETTEKKARAFLDNLRSKAKNSHYGTSFIPKITEAIEDWEKEQRSNNASEKHIKNCSRLFNAHVIPLAGDVKIDKLSENTIRDIKIEYLKKHSEHGCNTLLTYIKCLTKFCERKYGVKAPSIDLLNAQKKAIDYLEVSEIQPFLDEIDFKNRKSKRGNRIRNNPQVSFAVRAMIFMGLREGEVIGMRWANFNKTFTKYCLDMTKAL